MRESNKEREKRERAREKVNKERKKGFEKVKRRKL